MTILGLSFYYHDSAVCLLRNGVPIAMTAQERLSRTKHDNGFPKLAIDFVLKEGRVKSSALDYVVFYEKPFLKFDRILETIIAGSPKTKELFTQAMLEWLPKKLWIKSEIKQFLKVSQEKILFSDHHLSHAASAFYPSPFPNAAIITMDGVGEWATTTCGIGNGNKIDIYKEIRFPHSLGLFYSALTSFLGFAVNDGEYKVMGMAAFGKPRYQDKIRKTITQFPDGSFQLNLKYFSHHLSAREPYSPDLVKLLGQPRDPKSLFFTQKTGYFPYFGQKPKNFSLLAAQNQRYADVASSVQKVTEEVILNLVSCVTKETKQKNLCLAGGVALNSVANGLIMRRLKIKNVFVQPASGDDGGALGAALYLYHQILGHKRKFRQTHCFYGANYPHQEIKRFLEKSPGISYRSIPNDNKLFSEIVALLTAKKVVAWFEGKFEWGPRALGHRSILADPRFGEMKDVVNTKIKFREPYRPFAPSVLENEAQKIFDYEPATKTDPAKFMILVCPVKKTWQKKIPAVTHADGTGRLQTVDAKTNPRFFRLISLFYKKTGVPLVLNTSFNLKGEPIVNSPQDAYNTFLKSGLDCLVMGNFLVLKKDENIRRRPR